MDTYAEWENTLNSLGLFAPLDQLRQHIDRAPARLDAEEQETVQLAERVWFARATGRDVLTALHR